jgi:tetratricopeptide (TPR) repeat protein
MTDKNKDNIEVDGTGQNAVVAAGRYAKAIVVNIRANWSLTAVLVIICAILFGAGIYGYREFYIAWKCNSNQVPDFRVSIAGFVISDMDSLIDEKEVSNWEKSLAQRLQQSIDADVNNAIIQVWDSACSGKISGTTEDEWIASAHNIAEETESGLVVYGNIRNISATEIEVQPYFYISLQNAYEAYEILGPYVLGEPFSVTSLDPTTRRKAFNDAMQPKLSLLSKISIGLTNFSVGNYQQAEELFEETLLDTRSLSKSEQILLYVLAGNSAGKADDLDKATTLFQQAILLNPEYSRAHAGLGAVHYMQALKIHKASDEQSEKLDQDAFENFLEISNDAFQRASNAKYKHDSASIDAKVSFGMGQVALLRFLALNEIQDIDTAFRDFQQVIEIYNQADNNSSMKLLAAESHGRLGLISLLVSDCQDALAHYQSAYDLSWETSRKQLFEEKIQDIENKLETQGHCQGVYSP